MADTILVNRTDPFNYSVVLVKFGAGITKSDLIFSRQGNSTDLHIAIKGTSDQLTIQDQFGSSYGLFGQLWLDRIDGFKFADGSGYSWDEIIKMLDAQNQAPVIYGFDYPDTLNGGPGVHYISGGNEDHTYVFGPGYNFDTVEEATTNILSAWNTIASGVAPADVTFSLQGTAGDMLMTLADGSTMLVKDQFGIDIGSISFNRINNFNFADGSAYGITLTWDQIRQQIITAEEASSAVIIGTAYADVLDPGAGTGSRYLSGGNGADTYAFGHGYGHDTIDVNATGTDLLDGSNAQVSFKADVSESDVTWSRLDQDLVIKLNGTNDSLTVLGQFAGQYSGAASRPSRSRTEPRWGPPTSALWWRPLTLPAPAATTRSNPPPPMSSPAATATAPMSMRAATASIASRPARPWGPAMSTRCLTDIASTEVTLMRWPGRGINDLVIAIDGQNGFRRGSHHRGTVRLWGENPADAAINAITFADGVTWTEADIEAKLLAQEEAQTGANITVYGSGGADTLTARAGASTLVGGDGADTYVWSAGRTAPPGSRTRACSTPPPMSRPIRL